jgi:hypothetical protein
VFASIRLTGWWRTGIEAAPRISWSQIRSPQEPDVWNPNTSRHAAAFDDFGPRCQEPIRGLFSVPRESSLSCSQDLIV